MAINLRGMDLSQDDSSMVTVSVGTDTLGSRWIVKRYTGADFENQIVIENRGPTPSESFSPEGVAIAPDGLSFVVVGSARSSGVTQWRVVRYSGPQFETIELIDSTVGEVTSTGAVAYSVSYAPDGLSFVVAGETQEASVNDKRWYVKLYSGPGFSTISVLDHTDFGDTFGVAERVSFSPDGATIAVSGYSYRSAGSVNTWRVKTYSGAGYTSASDIDGVNFGTSTSTVAVRFSSDSSFFIVGGFANNSGRVRRYSGAGYSTIDPVVISGGPQTGAARFYDYRLTKDDLSIYGVGLSVAVTNAHYCWLVERYSGLDFATTDVVFLQTGCQGTGNTANALVVLGDETKLWVGGYRFTNSTSRYQMKLIETPTTTPSDSIFEDSSQISGSGTITEVATRFSPDGRSVFVAGNQLNSFGEQSCIVRRLTGATFSTSQVIDVGYWNSNGSTLCQVTGLDLSRDGNSLVVSASYTLGSIQYWLVKLYSGSDFATVATLEESFGSPGSSSGIARAVAFSPDGAEIYAAGSVSEGTTNWMLKKYSGVSFATETIIENDPNFLMGGAAEAASLDVSSDGATLAVGGWATDTNGFNIPLVRTYSGAGFATVANLDVDPGVVPLTWASGSFNAVRFSPDGTSIVAAGSVETDAISSYGRIWLVKKFSGAGFGTPSFLDSDYLSIQDDLYSTAYSVSFTPDGASVLVAGNQQTVVGSAQTKWQVRKYSGASHATRTLLQDDYGVTGGLVGATYSLAISPLGDWYISTGSAYTTDWSSLYGVVRSGLLTP